VQLTDYGVGEACRQLRYDAGTDQNRAVRWCDLGKKGSRKRQIEYAERTARKAIEQFEEGSL
jgi:hypothetical protein